MSASLLPRLSKQAITKPYPLSFSLQNKRLKTYLVGVDGSSYGFSALKNVSEAVRSTDKIISIHFPVNLAAMYSAPTIFDEETQKDIKKGNDERNVKIEEKCTEIIESDGPSNVSFEVKTGESTCDPAGDLIKACYSTKCDVLCVGSKGISHGLKEAVSDRLHHVGHIADYLMHNAPCDVLVIKEEHDNLQLK